MNTVTVSELKTRPSKIIEQSIDYPVMIEKRNQVKAYLIGKDLYDKLISYIEDYIDRKTIGKTDFKKGVDFDKISSELGI